jgi:hypothetical protein
MCPYCHHVKLVLLWAQLTKIYPLLGLDMTENRIFTLCRMITWVVFLRMFWDFISSLPMKRGGSLSFMVGTISNVLTAKVKIVKNERDPPLFTGKLLIKFQNILRNTTHVILRHRVKILFSVISSPITLERQKWKSSKMKGILVIPPATKL